MNIADLQEVNMEKVLDITHRSLPAEAVEAARTAIETAQASNTTRAYRTGWGQWEAWASEHNTQTLPADPDMVAIYLAGLSQAGASIATVRARKAAIASGHKAAGLENPTAAPVVITVLKGLSRSTARPPRQARGLTAEVLAAIRATAKLPRKGRAGSLESPEAASARGEVDIALASVMRDALLRRSEAASLTWGDVELLSDGTGRLTIRRSKNDVEGEGAVCFLGKAAASDLRELLPSDALVDPDTPVFGLSDSQIARRLQAMGQAAGLDFDLSGHSARVGMAQDLSVSGAELPALMTAGRWRSPKMPALYTRNEAAGRGAVARYYARK